MESVLEDRIRSVNDIGDGAEFGDRVFGADICVVYDLQPQEPHAGGVCGIVGERTWNPAEAFGRSAISGPTLI